MSRTARGPVRALISFAVFALLSVAVIAAETQPARGPGDAAAATDALRHRADRPLVVQFLSRIRQGRLAPAAPDAPLAWRE